MLEDVVDSPKSEPVRETVEQKIARCDQLKRLIPKLQEVLEEAKGASSAWLDMATDKIYGSGLASGNHRHYRIAHEKWQEIIRRSETLLRNSMPNVDAASITVEARVEPAEVLLKPAPNEGMLYNIAGDAPDQDRKMQHRVWHEQHQRSEAALSERINQYLGELHSLEWHIDEIASR